MKRQGVFHMKKLFLTAAALVALLAFAACGTDAEAAPQDAPEAAQAGYTVDQIQDNMSAHFGSIELTGTVTNATGRGFSLANDAGNFTITVDYRGSQALPANGDTVFISGNLREDCCNPGYILQSTRFEVVN